MVTVMRVMRMTGEAVPKGKDIGAGKSGGGALVLETNKYLMLLLSLFISRWCFHFLSVCAVLIFTKTKFLNWQKLEICYCLHKFF